MNVALNTQMPVLKLFVPLTNPFVSSKVLSAGSIVEVGAVTLLTLLAGVVSLLVHNPIPRIHDGVQLCFDGRDLFCDPFAIR